MNGEDIKTLRELGDWKDCPGKEDGKCQGMIDYVIDKIILPAAAKSIGKALNKSVVFGQEATFIVGSDTN